MRSRIYNAGARAALSPAYVSCRLRPLPRRHVATTADKAKPYYVTTPIFYVNAAPHVGHLSTMVLADVIKRWQVLQGKNALLCTGTDEHGLKVQQAATKAGSEPLAFCDKGADVFKNLAARANISNDYFVRTTETSHKEAVQYAWLLLQERGYIYSSKHEGWYSVSDEAYYPQSQCHLVLDPTTGRKVMTSIETGKEVEWTTEVNHHFRLSAFKDKLLEFYANHPTWILPRFRMDEVVAAVTAGLEDLSISRPTSRLTWGIRVPDDDSQTVYVWLDALLNYVTKAGYPWPPGEEQMTANGWPADCHVIGKDIIRFHCIYWPAFLMALSLPLPGRILTTGHWQLANQKMSKSLGNVVNPFFALDRFGPDTMRYYLAHDAGIGYDSNYNNYLVVERYKKGLQTGLGNLASRIIKPKHWSLRRAVETEQDHKPTESRESHAKARAHYNMLKGISEAADRSMGRLEINAALKGIMEAVFEANRFLQGAAPWTYVDKASASIPERHASHVNRTVYLCAETLRIVGILLQPYMPAKAAELLDMLGVDEQKRSFEFAQPGMDADYGIPKTDVKKMVLFPPLGIDEVETGGDRL